MASHCTPPPNYTDSKENATTRLPSPSTNRSAVPSLLSTVPHAVLASGVPQRHPLSVAAAVAVVPPVSAPLSVFKATQYVDDPSVKPVRPRTPSQPSTTASAPASAARLSRVCLRSLHTASDDDVPAVLVACLTVAQSTGSVSLLAAVAAFLLQHPTRQLSQYHYSLVLSSVDSLMAVSHASIPPPWVCPVCDMSNTAYDANCMMCYSEAPPVAAHAGTALGEAHTQQTLAFAIIRLMRSALDNLQHHIKGSLSDVRQSLPDLTPMDSVAFAIEPTPESVSALGHLADQLHSARTGLPSSTHVTTVASYGHHVESVSLLFDANMLFCPPLSGPVLDECATVLERVHRQAAGSDVEALVQASSVVANSVALLAVNKGGDSLLRTLERHADPDSTLAVPLLRAIPATVSTSRSLSDPDHAVRMLESVSRVIAGCCKPTDIDKLSAGFEAMGALLRIRGTAHSLSWESAANLTDTLLSRIRFAARQPNAFATRRPNAYSTATAGLLAYKQLIFADSVAVSTTAGFHAELSAVLTVCLKAQRPDGVSALHPSSRPANALRKEALTLLYAVVFSAASTATTTPNSPRIRCVSVLQNLTLLTLLAELANDDEALQHLQTHTPATAAQLATEKATATTKVLFLFRAAVGCLGEGFDRLTAVAPTGPAACFPPKPHVHRLQIGATTATLRHTGVTRKGGCGSPDITWTIARPSSKEAVVPLTSPSAGPKVAGSVFGRATNPDGRYTEFRPVGDVFMETKTASALGLLTGSSKLTSMVLRAEKGATFDPSWLTATMRYRGSGRGGGGGGGAGAGAGAGAGGGGGSSSSTTHVPPCVGAVMGSGVTPGAAGDPHSHLSVEVELVADPVSFRKMQLLPGGDVLWEPVPPRGYVTLGCVVEPAGVSPALTSVWCVHQSVVEPDTGALGVTMGDTTLYSGSGMAHSLSASHRMYRLRMCPQVPLSSLPADHSHVITQMYRVALGLVDRCQHPSLASVLSVSMAVCHDLMSTFSGLGVVDASGRLAGAVVKAVQGLACPGAVLVVGSMFRSRQYTDDYFPAVNVARAVMAEWPFDPLVQRAGLAIIRFVGIPHITFPRAPYLNAVLQSVLMALTRFPNDAVIQDTGSAVAAHILQLLRDTVSIDIKMAAKYLYLDGMTRHTAGGTRGAWPQTHEQRMLLHEKPKTGCVVM